MHPSQHQCNICGCHFSIGNASLGVATHESAEYHTGTYNTMLVELQFLEHLSSSQHNACDSNIAHFLHVAWSSDPKFHVTYYKGVPCVIYCIYNRVDQILVPKSSGFCEHLINELHVTPLASHLGVQKLTRTLFQRVWLPKLHKKLTSFVGSCTTFAQTKDSTGVPTGLLQPLPVPESCFSSYSIEFTTDLPLSHGCNHNSHLCGLPQKCTILIPCQMGDKTLTSAEIVQLFFKYLL